MAKDWAPLRDEIRYLWHIKGKPLKEVMHVMEVKHNFVASERAYRMQLQRWGYMKYNTRKSHGRRREPATNITLQSQLVPESISSETHLVRLPLPSTTISRPNLGVTDLIDTMILEHDSYESNHTLVEPPTEMQLHPMPSTPVNDQRDHGDKSPLHQAVIQKDKQLVSELLRAGAAIRHADTSGHEPIHYGVLAEQTEIVQLLLQFGGSAGAKGPLGRSPLHMAVSLFHLDMINLLIRHGSFVSEYDIHGDTPLHLALFLPFTDEKSQQLLTSLLEAGANVNAQNELGITPFQQLLDLQYPTAISHPDVPLYIMTTLAFLKQGAYVARPFADGRMPIEVYLARSNDTWAYVHCGNNVQDQPKESSLILQLLKECGPSTICMPSGEPLPHYYIRTLYGEIDVDGRLTKKLCDLADPVLVSGNGNTLLHEVMLRCHLGIEGLVKDLLHRGFNPNARNKEGQTPLHLLFRTADPGRHYTTFQRVLDALADYKINPWLQDNSGKCILLEAASKATLHGTGFLKKLLRDDLNRRPGVLTVWPSWEAARHAKSWAEASSLIFNDSTATVPATVQDLALQELAYAVLAEKHLAASDSIVVPTSGEIRKRRAYMAEILQDCRARHASVDMRFYDEILALCRHTGRQEDRPPTSRRDFLLARSLSGGQTRQNNVGDFFPVFTYQPRSTGIQ